MHDRKASTATIRPTSDVPFPISEALLGSSVEQQSPASASTKTWSGPSTKTPTEAKVPRFLGVLTETTVYRRRSTSSFLSHRSSVRSTPSLSDVPTRGVEEVHDGLRKVKGSAGSKLKTPRWLRRVSYGPSPLPARENNAAGVAATEPILDRLRVLSVDAAVTDWRQGVRNSTMDSASASWGHDYTWSGVDQGTASAIAIGIGNAFA